MAIIAAATTTTALISLLLQQNDFISMAKQLQLLLFVSLWLFIVADYDCLSWIYNLLVILSPILLLQLLS